MSFERRAAELFIDFPTPPSQAFAAATRQVGKLLFIGAALPFGDGRVQCRGRLGLGVTIDQGRQAARQACVQALAMVREALGDLDRIRAVVQLVGYIASGPEFHDQGKVLDGASQLLHEIFGAAGAHVRTAVGAVSLPHGAAVQIELIVEIK